MKKLTLILLLILTATMAQVASAMNYISTNDDLLLVFRQTNFKDVEFDLGSVSNFLNQPAGTSFPVSYNTNVCYTNFNSNISGVQFALVAATDSSAGAAGASSDAPARVWLTDANLTTVPVSFSSSTFNGIRNKIYTVGTDASLLTGNNSAPWLDTASDPNAYSYIVSDNTANIGSFGGVLPFTVETNNGGSLKFYEFVASTVNPKPAAKYVGTFTYAANGIVTFSVPSASVPLIPATITAVTNLGGSVKVYFTSTNNNNYRLLYTAAWPAVWQTNAAAGLVAGNNGVTNFTDVTSAGARYYRILSVP